MSTAEYRMDIILHNETRDFNEEEQEQGKDDGEYRNELILHVENKDFHEMDGLFEKMILSVAQ